MASDIPSGGFDSAHAMAKALVTYIDCPQRVRSILRENFNRVPDQQTIKDLRARHLSPKPAAEPIRSNDAYYPLDISRNLAETNRRFVMRIDIERALSARANGNAITERVAA